MTFFESEPVPGIAGDAGMQASEEDGARVDGVLWPAASNGTGLRGAGRVEKSWHDR